MTTILIADDHAVVREGIRGLLRLDASFEIVAETDDGTSTVEQVRARRPDVLLLDLMMPGMGQAGVPAAIRAIRAASADTHIMVLTSSDDDALSLAAIDAGADSFLLKSMRGERLLQAIHAAVHGEPTLHPGIAQRMIGAMRKPPRSPFAALTARELEVLRCLAEGGSNARIAATLGITEKTVKTHLGNVMSKLHLSDRTQAVALAWREGLMAPKA
ncbi:MAG: Transcriptional regulatory protein DegU [Burkholderia lata]|uniref:Transcriptional regulatory protein DegU n=1 Tax=Burkholderia lata (strain ATCC 17760 / DSM 23089 / LMG 22485 / NCIMB 9086 / R18194 / 383) TaxID=482957 RepID=A0A833PZ71_BURL3|nr:response regulator transcription factor [Burkholderia lata]KAF1040669.1 MAG: Transcriptional regulatory protein DegU [Burkholderia lata]